MSKLKAAEKTFEYFLERLLKGFRSVENREPNNLEMILIKQEAGQKATDANKVIQFPYKKSFGEEVDEMIAKGEVNVGTADKTPPYQKSQADIEFEIMEKIKSDNEKAIKAFESRNPNKKPRTDKYTGGMVNVEPNLSDIGHGSDSLMSRTRLISPGAQGTTSTGLNYLLAEDNDNIRVPFSKGKLADAARRKFMKTAGAGAAGLAALKTGLIGLGEKAAPVVEKAVEYTAPALDKIVETVMSVGDLISQSGRRLKELTTKKKFKDIEVEEDMIEVIDETTTKKADGGRIGYSKGKAVMDFLKIIKDPKKIREAIDNIFKTGDYKMDAEMAAESLVELNPQAFGNKLYDDLDDKTRMKVYSAVIDDVMGDVGKKIKEKKTDTYRFLKKVFGDSLDEMPDRDPEMYQGLKEVVPMFRKKDKEGLKMYMQKYLPHMDDTEIEEFIVGEGDNAGLSGQLIRLGSGRDYKGKLDMIKEANEKRKLSDLEVTEEMIRKPNASGGLAKMLGE